MSWYRRLKIEGGVFFFTVALADRTDDLLVRQVDRLRRMYQAVHARHPFETIAICILPDHIHAVWSLPTGDTDYGRRWSLIKSSFSRGLPYDASRTRSKIRKREKGLWQRRYWEHAIRDDADLARHVDYISFQSGQTRIRFAGVRLAAQQLPPLRGEGRSTAGLGWRSESERG